MKAIINGKLVFPEEIREGVILVKDGKILASGDVAVPEDAEIVDAKGAYVGPGLVDIHCHGYAQAGDNPVFFSVMDNPAEAAAHHLQHGTTSLTPSMGYSSPREEFLQGIRLCREAIDSGKSSIIGIHFEGPYINPKYGARSDSAWRYSKEAAREILDAAGDTVLHVTYAPEMAGAEELEDMLRQRGICMDLGHTEMDPESAERAVAKGARIITHLYDAMGSWRGEHWKNGVQQDSAALIALAIPGLFYELICDSRGIHVPPYCARMACRTAGEDNIILITDCVSRVSHDPRNYPEDSLMSAPDLNFNERGQLSGSRLVLSGACRNFIRYAGGNIRTAFKCAAWNPARALGLEERVGSILPGREANLLFVDEDFQVQKVIFRGEAV